MEFRRCQPPCVRFIAREDPHSKCIKCLGFSHARDAVYGTSKCKICDDFHLITLRSRLEDCERESSIFPRRASSTIAAPREESCSSWPDEPCESRASKLDERFLSGAHSKPERRKLPFFSDLHRGISSSWKQPFSSRLTNAAAADFTNLVGSVEQGYTAMPVIEDTLASHLSPSLAPSWKSRPLLSSKPCRTTSALIGKSYIVAGQAGMALHTMAILQAYQADVLKEMDEGTGLTSEAVKELRRATDLALRATKHTARAVGRSMAASVAAERHLWLNLTEIREREKVFLMDARISQSGLFGEAVSTVVDKFHSAKTQSAALKQFMPRRSRDYSTPSSSVSREQSLPRKEPPSGGA